MTVLDFGTPTIRRIRPYHKLAIGTKLRTVI
jgi:hypothetical protein